MPEYGRPGWRCAIVDASHVSSPDDIQISFPRDTFSRYFAVAAWTQLRSPYQCGGTSSKIPR